MKWVNEVIGELLAIVSNAPLLIGQLRHNAPRSRSLVIAVK